MRFICVPVALIASTLTIGEQEVLGQQDLEVEGIVRAWKNRQDSSHSGRFRWVEHTTVAKGSVMNPNISRKYNPKGLTLPPNDITYDSSYEFKFDGSKMHYTYKGIIWSPDGESAPQEYISVFDGQESKTFWPKGLSRIPSGVIRTEAHNVDIGNIHTRAILMAFRPLDPKIGLPKPDQYKIKGRGTTGNGQECLILEERTAPPQIWITSLWIDPNKDYTVARYVLSNLQGHIEYKLDVEYAADPKHGWIPSSWNNVWLKSNGSLRESYSAVVSDYVVNEPSKVGTIGLDFPPDTWVTDLRSNERYIARPGGEKRIIMEGERGAEYEAVLNSESGKAKVSQNVSSKRKLHLLLLVAMITGIVGLTALVLLRRLKRKAV